MTLEIGDKAPDFDLPSDGSTSIKLSDYRGKNIILYFYPKDSTPGCTTEAKDFSALNADFKAANAIIIGMSKDSVKRHNNFIAKQELTVRLASDEDGRIIEKYGVWILKKLYGREYMGIERATFLIDTTGTIRQIWHKVKVKEHAASVLKVLKAL
jgi:thioredoxin-dependent peroxiredoxin